MDLTEYRNSTTEQLRIADLLGLVPDHQGVALDVGARDGFISKLLAERFDRVVALDLEMPEIAHNKVDCVIGDVTNLSYSDNQFDFVFCAEVLEHIPSQLLAKACEELARVTKRNLLIGVPYAQDTRVGRMTCAKCGGVSPPWGHLNSFDEARLATLFHSLTISRTSFVGVTTAKTNWLSTRLMDYAGNPFGPYSQDEPCGHCGSKFQPPPGRTIGQRIASRLAHVITNGQQLFVAESANWIHILLKKQC